MTSPPPDEDRLREAWMAGAGGSAPAASCPAPERIWEAARGELPPGQARAIVAHTAGCGGCAEAWRLARELPPPLGERAAGGEQGPSGRTGWDARRALLAAAAGLVVALAAVVAHWTGPAERPGFRDAGAAAIHSLVQEDTPLPRSRCLLRWSGGPPQARYTLQVTTDSLEPILHVRGLAETEHLVPAALLTAVPPGGRLLWRVEAVGPDGSRVASGSFVARLR